MFLAPVAVFRDLPAAERSRLEAGSMVLEPRDSAEVFSAGDPADAVYAIIGGTGRVRIGAMDRRTKALMVEIVGVGEIFGEIAVIDGGARTAVATTEGRVRLAKISAVTFRAVLAESPALGQALCCMMARRLRRTFDLFQDATFETLAVRLAKQVLYLAERDGRVTDQGLRVAGRFRHSDLADLLGTTPRSIITILNALRAEEIVSYDTERATLTIRNMAAMQGIVSADLSP